MTRRKREERARHRIEPEALRELRTGLRVLLLLEQRVPLLEEGLGTRCVLRARGGRHQHSQRERETRDVLSHQFLPEGMSDVEVGGAVGRAVFEGGGSTAGPTAGPRGPAPGTCRALAARGVGTDDAAGAAVADADSAGAADVAAATGDEDDASTGSDGALAAVIPVAGSEGVCRSAT